MRRGRLARAAEIVCFGVLPAAVTARGLAAEVREPGGGGFVDFHQIWVAAGAIADGRSPYPTADVAAEGHHFLYPPLSAVAAVPLQALPYAVAAVCFSLLLLAAMLLSLRLVGVHDWRCYGVVALAMPTQWGIMTGTLSPLLALAAAAAWRYRKDDARAAIAVGTGIALKLFVWPLAVWLLFVRGVRAALLGGGVALLAVAASWAALGFADVLEYPSLLGALEDAWASRSYSVVATANALGVGAPHVIAFALGGLLLAAAGLLALRSRLPEEVRARRTFVLTLTAALVLTPILWIHYLTLLLVPLAIARPRLSAVWLVPFALFFVGLPSWADGSIFDLAVVWVAIGVLASVAFWSGRPAWKPAYAPTELAEPA